MGNLSDFLEEEFDRAYEHLVIAQTILSLPLELSENSIDIVNSPDNTDIKYINTIKEKLPIIDSKISETKILLSKIKKTS